MTSRATEPIEGSASPRKPSVPMAKRSPSGSLEVAWRSTASARSSGVMPAPSSTTRISSRPPAAMVTAMARAPASMAFSTSSLTAAAGRSITSPAAMRSTRTGSRRRTVMICPRPSRRIGRGTGQPNRSAAPLGKIALGEELGLLHRRLVERDRRPWHSRSGSSPA